MSLFVKKRFFFRKIFSPCMHTHLDCANVDELIVKWSFFNPQHIFLGGFSYFRSTSQIFAFAYSTSNRPRGPASPRIHTCQMCEDHCCPERPRRVIRRIDPKNHYHVLLTLRLISKVQIQSPACLAALTLVVKYHLVALFRKQDTLLKY